MQIRDSIKALFPDRDCLTLVRPMGDEKMLAKLETLDPSQFRPEFQEVCGLSLLLCASACIVQLHVLPIPVYTSLHSALPHLQPEAIMTGSVSIIACEAAAQL